MKWTTLRLNMLPITAVQVQFACQTLTNLHNALVDAVSKQNINFPIQIQIQRSQKILSSNHQPYFPASVQKSNPFFTQTKSLMTYDKLIIEYEKLKSQIQLQIKQLKDFYTKHSHDSSASLFHMLRLRLQRTLFDCSTDKNQLKKVLTKVQQDNQYLQIAKQFQSNQIDKIQVIPKRKSTHQNQFLDSCDTFKTENYNGYQTGYQNQFAAEISKNQFLELQNQDYQELNFEPKNQNKKYIQEIKLQSKQKPKKSISPSSKNIKGMVKKQSVKNQKIQQRNIKQGNVKTPKKIQPSSQMTIATQHEKQKNIQPKSSTINLNKIHNDQNSYKNLKVLTTNNVPVKTINKNQMQSKIPRQTFSNACGVANKELGNQKNIKLNQKTKGYVGLNQQKQEQKRKIMNENKIKSSNSFIKVQSKVNKQVIEKQKSNSIAKQKLSPRKVGVSQKSRNNTQIREQIIPQLAKPKNEQKQISDLKQMLISSGSELRFTIKMSRDQYKSLLQLKNKMNNKQTN